jgi:hypothetical protein
MGAILGLAYMVTGSMASNYYGNPRLTNNIDIVVMLREDQLSKIATAFQETYYVAPEAIQQAMENKSTFNVIDSTSGMKIDFWLVKNDAYSQEAFSRRREGHLFGESLWLIAPEDLILAKWLWAKQSGGSAKQEADIAGVMDVQGEALDKHYLQSWKIKLGL